MTLTELRYIVAVARERHFGRAAERCFVSQPTLSIAIKKFEEELGVTLFERNTGKITTTQQGEAIVAQALKVLEEAENIKSIAEAAHDELEGVLRLGLIFTIAPYILPKLILNLRTLAPKMPLQLEENYTGNLLKQLKEGTLDAVIAAEPLGETGLVSEPLYDEPFFVIVPHGHAFEGCEFVTSRRLAKEQILLLTEGNCMRNNVLDSCSELAARQKIHGLANQVQGSSINTIRHMVASGMGISVLPASALTKNDHLLFSVVPFKPPVPMRRVVLVSRQGFIRQRALRALARAISSANINGIYPIRSHKALV